MLTAIQQELAARNTAMARHVARSVFASYSEARHLGLPDCESAALLGLCHAARCYDPDRGARFSTYATFAIRHAILSAAQRESRTIRIPKRAYARHGIESFDRLRWPIRLGHYRTHDDRIVDDAPAPEDVVIKEDEAESQKRQIKRLRRHLTGREWAILRRYYLEGQILSEIGEAIGISKERVRQIKARAIYKLKRVAERKGSTWQIS